MLVDTKTMSLGDKRNKMVDLAQGEYVVHVDSDDRLAPNYIESLLDATKSGCDVITFLAEVTLNGGKPKVCDYSIHHQKDYNTDFRYFRIPNHITAIKREYCLLASFPSICYGEDSLFAKLILKHLKTEHRIDKVLYYYDFNSETTETQEHIKTSKLIIRKDIDPIVDIIILSNAKDENYKRMCQTAIDTCIAGANGLRVNIIVIEQNERVSYSNATTIHKTEPIHYNRFMNLGASKGKAEWIMFCNSDLIFQNGWLHSLLVTNHPLMSPKSPNDNRQKDIMENQIGDVCGRHLSGWAIFMKRSLWSDINGLPEITNFWFSDNATIQECKKVGILPMLVPSSVVTHLGSATLKTLDKQQSDDITWAQCKIYNDHYGKNHFADNPHYQEYLKRTVCLENQ